MIKLRQASQVFIAALWIIAFGGCAHRTSQTKAGPNDAPLIARQVLFGNPDITFVRISPSGKYISYLAPLKGVLNIFLAPVDRPDKAVALTKVSSRSIRYYRWAYNDRDILFDQDSAGDENWQLWSVNIESKKSRLLTPQPKTQAHIVKMNPDRPSEIVIALNPRDARFHDLFLLNLDSGEQTLLEENTGYKDFMVDRNYRVRLASKFADDGSLVYYEKEDDHRYREFIKVPAADSLSTFFHDFDKSGQVLYMNDSRRRDTAALVALDFKTRTPRLLSADARSDVGTLLVHPRNYNVEAVSFEFEKKYWKFLDPLVEEDFKKLGSVDRGEILVTSRSLDDRSWIVAFNKDNGPLSYYLFDRDSSKARFLFVDRKDLGQEQLSPMESQIIPTSDGFKLVTYLTRAKGATGPAPIVLLVHGGPWARDSWGFEPTHQLLSNRGYHVLSVNFRGSSGFGKKFLNAGNKEWGARMQQDLNEALRWAVEQKIADPSRIAIMGGSYGGYATLVGLTLNPELFACGVDIVGPSNLNTLLASVPPYWTSVLQIFKDRVGDPGTAEGRALLDARSPLNFISKINKPLLIAQGANDPRVKQSESDQIVAALRSKNIPVTYVLYPDEGHGFSRPENNLSFMAITEQFLAKCLGGRAQSFGRDLKDSSLKVLEGAEEISGLKKALR